MANRRERGKPPSLVQQNLRTYSRGVEFDDIPDTIFESEEAKRVKSLESQLAELQSQVNSGGNGIAQIGQSNIRIDATGLQIIGEIAENDFDVFVEQVGKLKTAYQWVVGDLVVYSTRYGEHKIERVAEILGENPRTIEDWAYICRNVQNSYRNENLSLTHHRMVASLDAQYQQYFLGVAQTHKLSSGQLEVLVARVKSEADIDAILLELKQKVERPHKSDVFRDRATAIRASVFATATKAPKKDRQRWLRLAQDEIAQWQDLIDKLSTKK